MLGDIQVSKGTTDRPPARILASTNVHMADMNIFKLKRAAWMLWQSPTTPLLHPG